MGNGFIGPWTSDHVEFLTHTGFNQALRPLETFQTFHKCFIKPVPCIARKRERKNTCQVGLFKDQ